MSSKTLHAVIQNGRYLVEESADPTLEGKRVTLQLVEAPEETDDEEREKLHAALKESIAQADAGELISQEELYARLGWK